MRSVSIRRGHGQGFTLIEVMIVVVIVGILAGIGYPLYTDYVLRGKRTDGKAAIQELMNREERHYTENSTYTTDIDGELGYDADPTTTEDGAYEVSAVQCAGAEPLTQCVRVEAEPQGRQADDTCDTLWRNSRGQQGATGAGECW